MSSFYELAEKALALERSGKKLIKLNVGGTNIPTPQCALDAAIDSIKTSRAGYGSGAGSQEFRQKIAEREGCEIDNVVVGSGSKQIIYSLLSILCKANDSIAFPSPYWPAYPLAAKQLGISCKITKTTMDERWEFNNLKLDEVKLLILCNPLNPTSTVYHEELVNAAIAEANKKNVPLIIDEAYKGLAFNKMPNYEGYENVIRVRSFSKEFNMEGWRLGYAVAPKEIVKKMVSFNQITTTCTPEFVQRAGIACLENEKKILESNRKIWQNRAQFATSALKNAGFEFIEPGSGIYIFAKHEKIKDMDSFSIKLLDEQGVVIAPGSGFGEHQQFARICLNQKTEVLGEAMAKIKKQLT